MAAFCLLFQLWPLSKLWGKNIVAFRFLYKKKSNARLDGRGEPPVNTCFYSTLSLFAADDWLRHTKYLNET